jgi:hypothetical protein
LDELEAALLQERDQRNHSSSTDLFPALRNKQRHACPIAQSLGNFADRFLLRPVDVEATATVRRQPGLELPRQPAVVVVALGLNE